MTVLNGSKPLVVTGLIACLPGLAAAVTLFINAGRDIGTLQERVDTLRTANLDSIVKIGALDGRVTSLALDNAGRAAELNSIAKQLDEIKDTLRRIERRTERPQ